MKYDLAVKPNRYFPFAVAFFFVSVSSGQTVPTGIPHAAIQDQAANNPKAVLRVTTRLVQLNVIVQDKNGKLIDNLTQEDFTLLDNGKPQTISLFSTESVSQPGISSAAGDIRNASAAQVFGNRIPGRNESPGSVTVVLFDALNTSFSDQVYAKAEILAFLRSLQPQDRVAVYLLTNQLTVIHEFTQDSQSLFQAIERLRTSPSLLQTNSNQPYMSPSDAGLHDRKAAEHLANMVNDSNGQSSDLANLQRMQITAQALEAIANHVAGIPGRKNLVWVSGSFPVSIALSSNEHSPVGVQSQNFTPVLERVTRALNQSDLAIYPVDARGILIPSDFDPSTAHPLGPYGPVTANSGGQDEQATMDLLAERTGGRAFINTNDIQGALRRTLSESRFTYLVGFYPTHGNWDGQFHTLKLRVKHSGCVLRYRKGYFALADPPDTTVEARVALQAALQSPLDASGIGFQVRIQKLDLAARKLELRVNVDGSQLALEEVNGRRKGSFDAIYFQLGSEDAILTAVPLTYQMDFGEKDYQSILARGYDLNAPLLILPATRTLRVVVRDAASGALGRVTIPLTSILPPTPSSK